MKKAIVLVTSAFSVGLVGVGATALGPASEASAATPRGGFGFPGDRGWYPSQQRPSNPNYPNYPSDQRPSDPRPGYPSDQRPADPRPGYPSDPAPSPAPAPAPAPTSPPSAGSTGGSERSQVLSLVNAERQKAGCGAVSANGTLDRAAQGHSEDMASRGYFSHESPGGGTPSSRISAAGYDWSATGENIASGQRSADEVMRAWMNSSGHRANILNCRFRDLGVGIAANASGSLYWTQNFATPR